LRQEAFCMAASIPAPTFPGQAVLKSPVFSWHLLTKPACPHAAGKALSRRGGSTFPASAHTKGITHYTLQAKSCANRDAARPYWMTQLKAPILQTI